jgi:outer membrane biosynthesis protein TonB
LQLHAFRPQRNAKRLAGDGGGSLLIHIAVITGAIYATQSGRPAGTPAAFDTAFVVIGLPEPQYALPPTQIAPLKDFQTVTVPAVIPTAMPPIHLQEHFDPKNFVGASREGQTTTGVTPVADLAYDPNLVDDPPILISAPPLFPALLPQAGPTSRVVVQAVIDTAGRAEPASVCVIQSADTAFDQHAQQWMLEALWRPARVAGHPVRLRVNRAIDYTSTRRR